MFDLNAYEKYKDKKIDLENEKLLKGRMYDYIIDNGLFLSNDRNRPWVVYHKKYGFGVISKFKQIKDRDFDYKITVDFEKGKEEFDFPDCFGRSIQEISDINAGFLTTAFNISPYLYNNLIKLRCSDWTELYNPTKYNYRYNLSGPFYTSYNASSKDVLKSLRTEVPSIKNVQTHIADINFFTLPYPELYGYGAEDIIDLYEEDFIKALAYLAAPGNTYFTACVPDQKVEAFCNYFIQFTPEDREYKEGFTIADRTIQNSREPSVEFKIIFYKPDEAPLVFQNLYQNSNGNVVEKTAFTGRLLNDFGFKLGTIQSPEEIYENIPDQYKDCFITALEEYGYTIDIEKYEEK